MYCLTLRKCEVNVVSYIIPQCSYVLCDCFIQIIPGDIVQLVCAMPSANDTCARVLFEDITFDYIFDTYFQQVSYVSIAIIEVLHVCMCMVVICMTIACIILKLAVMFVLAT